MLWLTGSLDFFIFYHFYIELCYFQSSIISILTLFGAAHGWQKDFPLSKMSHTYLAMMKLRTVIPYLMKIQKHLNHLEQPLIFDFFIGNLQILLYQEIQILIAFLYIISNSFNIFWIFKDALINIVTILMMSAKMATLGLLKIKVF